MHNEVRFHYIDNLRSFALLLGVVFHAALAYGPFFSNIWLTADPSNHVLFDYMAIWSHLFRMPLFFVIAGFCAALLIAKRTRSEFIKNRLKRILLPFLVAWPITLALLFHAMYWGAQIADPAPAIFSVIENVENPSISTVHLWFLWNLMQFCIFLWLLSFSARYYENVLSFVVRPVFLCVITPFLVSISMIYQVVPFPAPDKFYPQLWSWGFYGVLFLIGAGVYKHHNRVSQYFGFLMPLLAIACFSTAGYFYYLPAPISLEEISHAANTGLLIAEKIDPLATSLQTLAILCWTAIFFLCGYKWLNYQNRVCQYISDASYWIYLIHIPILMYVQLPLINTALSPFFKFIVSVSATMLIGLLSYHYGVRYTFIGKFLNGKKHIK